MRNSAIGCACLLAVFEGVGIAMQRMFAAPPVVLFLRKLLSLILGARVSSRTSAGLSYIPLGSHLIFKVICHWCCHVESVFRCTIIGIAVVDAMSVNQLRYMNQ